jgi:hypothetical protein
VGVITFDEEIVDHVPPSAKHFDVVLHTLDRAQATRPGRLGPPLKKLAEHFGRRSIVVIISDLYDEPDAVLEAVAPIRFRGNDVVIFHVLDPAEIDFTFTDPSAFEDIETGESLPIVPDRIAEEYRALMRTHTETLASRCAGQRIDYTLMLTSVPLDFALFSFLSARERSTRVR